MRVVGVAALVGAKRREPTAAWAGVAPKMRHFGKRHRANGGYSVLNAISGLMRAARIDGARQASAATVAKTAATPR